jgi:hypothetical protein
VSELERLKSLLLTPERERIQQLDQQLDALQQSRDRLPADLPGLLEQAHRQSVPGRMGRAIAEPVADALGEAVSRRRQSVVDALFPVIMPAIRRAIAEYLRVLSADINRLLESSFTPRGLGWRLQSLRTGVPYAEIAIKHSLRYRVDYLLLIQSESGLVLDRERAADVPELDSDAISGMLNAIGDFVRDSVAGAEGDRLSSATVGEHLLWVLEGPRAKLAAFIRGVPPESLKQELQARLESVHARFGDDLALAPEQIAGLPEIKDALTPDDLRSSQQPGDSAPAAASTLGLWLILLLVVVLVGGLWMASWRWDQRLAAAELRLRQWPGFHLAEIDSDRWRAVRLRGLLDPLADSPLDSLRTTEFPDAELSLDVRGYISTDPEIAERRLRLLLSLPKSVDVEISAANIRLTGAAGIALKNRLKPELLALASAGTLDTTGLRWDLAASVGDMIGVPESVQVLRTDAGWTISGSVDADWRDRLEALLHEYPDFGTVDRSALQLREVGVLDDINRRMLANPVPFIAGTALSDDAAAHIDVLAGLIVEASAVAARMQKKLVVDIFGINDSSGTEEQNAALRRERAQFLQEQLQRRLRLQLEYRLHAESTALVVTIRSRAALAQLRFQ